MTILNNMKNILYWKDEVSELPVSELKAENIPHLVPFMHQEPGEPYPCVIVLPGGGYQVLSEHESAPVAGWLNGLGISAFVLNYSVAPAKHPQPYRDVRRAIQWVRANAERLNIDPGRVGVLGFSAGGHLAGSAASWWEDDRLAIGDALDSISARPDLAVMCYPVVTGCEGDCNEESFNSLMDSPADEKRELFSLEKRIGANTPPIFIWHTADDTTVPVGNAFLMAQAMADAGAEYELHIFPKGIHGLGLCTIERLRNGDAGQWRDLCAAWLVRQGF